MPLVECQPLLPMEAPQRLIHGPFEHIMERAALDLDLEDVLLQSSPLADLAGHEPVREEHQLYEDVSRALTRLAAAPCHVERNRARRVAARPRQRLGGEQSAQLVERL